MHWASVTFISNSPLNAPLDAEIELVNATPEDLATLDAKLAIEGYLRPLRPRLAAVHGQRDGDARSRGERRAGTAHQVDRNGDRTLPDSADRSHVGARPPGARIHRVARSAGVRPEHRGRCARAGAGGLTGRRLPDRFHAPRRNRPPPAPCRRRPPAVATVTKCSVATASPRSRAACPPAAGSARISSWCLSTVAIPARSKAT